MRKLAFCIAIVLAEIGTGHAQSILIKVVSAKDQSPIHLAKISDIENEKINVRTAKNGFVRWVNNSDSVVISAWNFETVVSFVNLPEDTLVIALREQPEVLKEALVSPENSWLRNRIYAFERWESDWVFLSRKTIRVTDNKLDLIYKIEGVKIGNQIPTELFVDALENLFLIAEDSVQQLYITDTMAYRYPAIDIDIFNAVIKPMKLATNQGIVYRESKPRTMSLDPFFANVLGNIYYDLEIEHPPLHNCGALFYLRSKETNAHVYSAIDTAKYKSASAAWGNYMGAYIGFWLTHDATGKFDLAMQKKYGSSLHTYNTLHAHFRETYWIPVNNNFVVLDPYSDRLVLLDGDFNLTSTHPMPFDDCPKEDYFTIDSESNEWWLIREERKLQILHPIKPNSKKQPLPLDAFITNVRIHDNRAFYIDQYGTFRIKKIP